MARGGPVVPLDIQPIPDEGIWTPDGRVLGAVQLVLKVEDVERMRLGYVCAKCLKVFESAWPERCGDCGAPIRTEQAAYFAREFGGIVPFGPTTSLEEEIGMLEERRRKGEEAKK